MIRGNELQEKAASKVFFNVNAKEIEFRTAFADRHRGDKMDEKGYVGYRLVRAGRVLDELRVAKHIESVYFSK